ncbi:unnamed protein product, partial [Didymodactylos carnosus]
LKATQHVVGTYQLYSSSCHNHQQRADSNRLLSPIRDNIRQMTDKGLTAVQIKKIMKVLHPDLFIDSKVLWYDAVMGTRQMPQEIGKRQGKGRPKKVKYALSRD